MRKLGQRRKNKIRYDQKTLVKPTVRNSFAEVLVDIKKSAKPESGYQIRISLLLELTEDS